MFEPVYKKRRVYNNDEVEMEVDRKS